MEGKDYQDDHSAPPSHAIGIEFHTCNICFANYLKKTSYSRSIYWGGGTIDQSKNEVLSFSLVQLVFLLKSTYMMWTWNQISNHLWRNNTI